MQKLGLFKIAVILVVILALVLFVTKTNPFSSQPTLITVVGEGKVKSNAELAQFSVSYITASPSASSALNSEKAFRQKIIALLTGPFGVNANEIQVAYPKVSATATVNGILYQAVNTMDVDFKKIQELDTAIAKLYMLGDISISNIVFTTANPRSIEDQAIAKAYEDGRTRAEKVASSLGKKLGKLVSVAGQQTQAVGTITRDAGETKGTTTTPGQIEIVRNVSLVYEVK